MIDSHCHLDHEPLLSDLANVIKRSKEVGIEKLLTISTSFESFSRVKDLINKDEMIYGTIGIHPHESSTDIITSKQIIESLNENSKIIGIGETGLDFYYNHSEKNDQISCFEEHIHAAQTNNFPIIVHTRSAEKETLEIVRKISFLLYPIIPESSLKALNIFDIEEKDVKLDTVSNNEYLTKGNNIHKIDILFKKIEKNND